ncbi:MAG: hypothetical protein LC105_06240 [Chitinophagales bacterium]|nr:hypothetical protein [Chitinophagales bacterium]
MVYILLGLLFYNKIDTYYVFPSIFKDVLFSTSLLVIWLIAKYWMRRWSLNDTMESYLRHNNTNKLTDYHGISNYLLWPYFIKGFEIYKRPGRKYILFLLWSVVIVIGLTALLLDQEVLDITYFNTYIFILLIPIALEWIIYLEIDDDIKETEEKDLTPEKKKDEPQLLELYKRYVDNKDGFGESVIMGFVAYNTELHEQTISQKDEIIQEYINKLTQENKDVIVSDGYLLENIKKFAPTLLNSLKNGGNVLFLTDIPDYSKIRPKDLGIHHPDDNKELNYGEILSFYLKEVIERDIPFTKGIFDIGYYTKGETDALDKRIILTNISDALSKELLDTEWAKNIDLIIVIQQNDSYFDNLTLSRNLSLWLNQFNQNFRLLFFKPYTTGGDDSMTNIWISSIDPLELKLENVQTSSILYFIDFAFEKSKQNLRKLFVGSNDEFDLTPGVELSIFALLEDLKHIHYFEGFNMGFLQSKNLLSTMYHSLKRELKADEKISQIAIEKYLRVNNSPIVFIDKQDKLSCKDEHLSIIYDIENNAPRLYKKYINLGKNESFICVVSKPHIFREYFAQNIKYFLQNTINPLQPLYTKSTINLCLQLFYLLQHNEVDVRYVEKIIHTYTNDIKGMSTIQFIEHLFNKYLRVNIERNSIIKSTQKEIFNTEKKCYEETYLLSIENTVIESIKSLHFIETVKVEDTSGNVLMELPKYLTFQNILPQQGIVINGIYYEYVNFDKQKNILKVAAKPQDLALFYAPNVKVTFKKEGAQRKSIDVKDAVTFYVDGNSTGLQYAAEVRENDIETIFESYFKFQNNYHSPKSEEGTPLKIELKNEVSASVKRAYHTRYLHIKWEVSDQFKKHYEEINTHLHILFFEVLKVLFPYHHQYIHVLSNNQYNKEVRDHLRWIFTENNFTYSNDDDRKFVEFIFLEDSFSDLGLLNPLKDKFESVCRYLYDYLLWVEKDDIDFLESNYMRMDKNDDFFSSKSSFLKYGIKDFDWNFILLSSFIKKNSFFDSSDIADNFENRWGQQEKNIIVECDYCAQKYHLNEVEVLEGGLHRCLSCAEDAADTEKDAAVLHEEAKSLYAQVLKDDFSTLNYSFHFVNYIEFAQQFNLPFKVTNKYDKRVAVGMASDVNPGTGIDEVWIEKYRKKPFTLSTIVHEMMHIYQFQKLNYFKMKYDEPELIEGMTTWAEWYILSHSKHTDYQNEAEAIRENREIDTSEYGNGFRYIIKKYNGDKVSILPQILKKYKV